MAKVRWLGGPATGRLADGSTIALAFGTEFDMPADEAAERIDVEVVVETPKTTKVAAVALEGGVVPD